MDRRLIALSLAVFSLIFGACDHEKAVVKALNLKFDPGLTAGERKVLVDDVYELLKNKVKPKPGSPFEQIFGKHGVADIATYLHLRVNYLISSRTPVNDSLRWTDMALNDILNPGSGTMPADIAARVNTAASAAGESNQDGLRDRFRGWIGPGVPRPGGLGDKDAAVLTVAENIGITLWILQESSRPARVAFQLGDTQIPLLSSRVGLIRIGSAYPSFNKVVRMATLVHEARHSDCTGGLSREQLQRFRNGRGIGPSLCGHLHARCPVGHEYAGELACDALPWGSYSVEAVYASAMSEKCSNCSQREKQLARMLKLDAVSRVIVYDSMMRGELGPPDMSSSGMELSEVRRSLQNFRAQRMKDRE